MVIFGKTNLRFWSIPHSGQSQEPGRDYRQFFKKTRKSSKVFVLRRSSRSLLDIFAFPYFCCLSDWLICVPDNKLKWSVHKSTQRNPTWIIYMLKKKIFHKPLAQLHAFILKICTCFSVSHTVFCLNVCTNITACRCKKSCSQ